MERAVDILVLSHAELEAICRDYFKTGNLQSYESLSGGAIHTTYKIVWDNTAYVVRFYAKEPELAELEEAIFRFIHHQVPMPELLYSGFFNSLCFSIFEFVDKKHISEISPSLATSLSYDLGKALASIHGFCFAQAGLFGKSLTIQVLFHEGSSPYYSYIMDHLLESSLAWQRLGEARARDLRSFLLEHQDFFPKVHQGGVLVHSDFKPVNLLWDQKGGLTILDWEFAHSGHPLIDFAVLLRHFRDFPLNIDSLEKGYKEHGGAFVDDWIRKARLTDVINVVQLLNESAERPKLFKSLLESVDLTLQKWLFLEKEVRKKDRR